jgi:hypothetical protein
MSFLHAEWRKLAIANYVVDPGLLQPFVPKHTELDFWNDRCYVSLVGFMFLNTKMLGIKIPFHVNFEEVNLRFYVRHHDGKEWKRGVVFVREIVPKPALSLVANTLYKEHYATMPMKHNWEEQASERMVSYLWKSKGAWQHFAVRAELQSQPLEAGGETEFITEHYWGYTQAGPDKTFEYEVSHPRWEAYPVIAHDIQVDFGRVYGQEFAVLNNMSPQSVMLAEGSEIRVENKRTLP